MRNFSVSMQHSPELLLSRVVPVSSLSPNMSVRQGEELFGPPSLLFAFPFFD